MRRLWTLRTGDQPARMNRAERVSAAPSRSCSWYNELERNVPRTAAEDRGADVPARARERASGRRARLGPSPPLVERATCTESRTLLEGEDAPVGVDMWVLRRLEAVAVEEGHLGRLRETSVSEMLLR